MNELRPALSEWEQTEKTKRFVSFKLSEDRSLSEGKVCS